MFGFSRTAAEVSAIAGATIAEVEALRLAYENASGKEEKQRAFWAYKSAQESRKAAQRTGTPRH